MEKKLRDRLVIVTGGAKRIGEGVMNGSFCTWKGATVALMGCFTKWPNKNRRRTLPQKAVWQKYSIKT